MHVEETGCIYKDDGVIGKLVNLSCGANWPKYFQTTDIINLGIGGSRRLDSIVVYVSQLFSLVVSRISNTHGSRMVP